MTPTATARGGRSAIWTRDNVIKAIQRWVEVYGEPPRAADWNPSSAKWSAATWRIERYHAGDPESGAPWPSLNAAKKAFDGRLTDAIRAAGFEPNKPGPRNRKDIRPEVVEKQVTPEVRAALDAARADTRDLAERVRVLEGRLERTASSRDRLREERDMARRAAEGRKRRTITKTKTKTKTVIREDKASARKLERVREDLAEAKRKMTAARTDALRLASKLERAEKTINDLRGERRELKDAVKDAELTAAVAERALEPVKRELAEAKAKADRVEKVIITKDAPEQAIVDEARAEALAAGQRARDAERRAAVAEREYGSLAALVTGERRRLTRAEVQELKRKGPAGPALVAEALKKLALARKKGGNPTAVSQALTDLAGAAVSWRERL